jgi:hypothetical protein
LDEPRDLSVAQFSAHPASFAIQAPPYNHSLGRFAQPGTHENTGFCHLGQAYNSRKGSTYTHAATVAASL